MARVPSFRSGLTHVPTPGSGSFVASALPSEQKKQLCRQLLAEFGVTHVTERHGELIHSCCLPFGAHKNGDRNASASLNYEKLAYNCFGCGSSGGLLWFIAVCRGEETRHSRDWLEHELGFGDDEESVAKLLEWIDLMSAPKERERAQIPKMARSVLKQWRFIHPYMTEDRRIPVETYKHFEVGYGTIRTRLPDDTWVDSERIIIPHFWKGDLVGWQSRRLDASDGTAKYLSSPDMPKDLTIYNYDAWRPALVVESPMSVLSKWHIYPGIEATFGAKVTDRQIKLLAEHPTVTLWMDNDEAGWKATRRLGDELSSYCQVWVVPSSWAADPADLTDDEFERLMNERIPYALWSEPKQLEEWKAA